MCPSMIGKEQLTTIACNKSRRIMSPLRIMRYQIGDGSVIIPSGPLSVLAVLKIMSWLDQLLTRPTAVLKSTTRAFIMTN